MNAATDHSEDHLSGRGRPKLHLDVGLDPAGRRLTASQLAYDVVRRSIMRGLLQPGTRLGQNELASELSLSTTPVREALRRLAAEGLVQIDTHRGALVRGLDLAELDEVYELRLLLEPLAIRKAAERITEEELAGADLLLRRMDEIEDPGAWAETNREFHAVFARATRSPSLIRILGGLRDSAAPYVQLSIARSAEFAAAANNEHRQLLEACRRRDGDEAAAVEEAHLRGTLHAVRSNTGPD